MFYREYGLANIDSFYTKHDVIKHLALIFHGPGYEYTTDLGPGLINFDVHLFKRGKGQDEDEDYPQTCTGEILYTLNTDKRISAEYGYKVY